MPRNGSGTMSVVNTFVAGASAAAAEVNANFTDVASEITGSLPRDGQAAMTGQMKSASGTVSAPGVSFSSDLDCGLYRIGADDIGFAIGGAKIWEATSTGLDIASGKALTIGGSAALKASNNLSDVSAKYTAFDALTVHGADVASAATIDLDAATGNLVDVTGTTSITAITLADGRERTVRFTGSLTLTHGASLVLPDAANIQTAAGDFAVFRGYASSVVRCVSYHRLNRHGSDVASAGTLNLDTATGDVVDVTGTTTITAITLADGRTRTVRFTGALTLTHGASLVLPGAVNITTAAGDYAIFQGYASGVVRLVSYQKASQSVGPAQVLLATLTASSSASLTDTTSLTSVYNLYFIVIEAIVPATNSVTLKLQVSTDGGSSYLTSSYASALFVHTSGGTSAAQGYTDSVTLTQANLLHNGSSYGWHGHLYIGNPAGTGERKRVWGQGAYSQSAGQLDTVIFSGFQDGGNSAVNAIKFVMSSGNIASGKIYIYGVKTA